jgi:mannosyl-oligosaccharide glucosidase
VWFYSGVEGLGKMELVNEPDEMGLVGNVNLKGSIPRLGEFKLQITTGPKTNKNPTSGHTRPLDRTHYVSVEKPSKDVWRAKGAKKLC